MVSRFKETRGLGKNLEANTADSHPQSMGEICPTFGGPGFDAQHQKREEEKKKEEEKENKKREAWRGYGRPRERQRDIGLS